MDFDSIINSYDSQGAILIFDPQKKTYYSNNFERSKTGFLPASTFKITNAIIALESSTISSDTTIFKWDGKRRDFESWEKDLTFREAFQASCVPCFQEVARKIGVDQMQTYINKLHYPQMDVRKETIDNFWLRGTSKITPFEQIDFLNRFYTKKLPILNSTRNKMIRILEIDKTDSYTLSGKTGWSFHEKNNNGWFVGFVEIDKNVYYFALNMEPKKESNIDPFLGGRVKSIKAAFHAMKLL